MNAGAGSWKSGVHSSSKDRDMDRVATAPWNLQFQWQKLEFYGLVVSWRWDLEVITVDNYFKMLGWKKKIKDMSVGWLNGGQNIMGDQNLLVMVIEEILIFPFLEWEVASCSNYFPLQGPSSASLDQHPVFFLLGFGTWVPPLKKPCWASLFQPQGSRDAKPEEPQGWTDCGCWADWGRSGGQWPDSEPTENHRVRGEACGLFHWVAPRLPGLPLSCQHITTIGLVEA